MGPCRIPAPSVLPTLRAPALLLLACRPLPGTGVLAGVFRSAISLVVLVVEGTRGIDYMFGVILAVVIANWVAHHIHHDGGAAQAAALSLHEH